MDIKLFNIYLHTSVTAINIVAAILSVVLLACSPIEYHQHSFLLHGWNCKSLFLSLWVAAVQYIYFFIYSAIDIIEIYYSSHKLSRKFKHYMNEVASYLLFTIVFPCSVFVFLLFWSVYLWNRDVIYPPVMDKIFPSWINHVVHTFPVPLSIIYMLTSNKREPSKLFTFSGLIAFLSIYAYVFFDYYTTKGKWIYIALEVMSPTQVKWVLSLSLIGPICFLFVGHKLNKSLAYIKKHSPMVMMS